jgi:ABC-2 type transport system ATP-binding protein
MNKLVKEFELDLNKKIEDLSYGNKKKVGIIQGLLHDPDLIILDEPTSGLDPLMQQKFFKILEAENKRGATILFSSHILSEVQRLCDRVCIIKEGKVISIKKISELEKESYKKVKLEVTDKVNKKDINYEGINNLEVDDNKVTFLYKGNIDDLVKKISKYHIKDIWIEDPSLEEIFLHYYE